MLRDRDTSTPKNGELDERLYALQDANFNVVALAGTDGTIQERYIYPGPFGADLVVTGTFGSRGTSSFDWEYRYTTRRRDAATGLYHYRRRPYHMTLGRFPSRDPINYWAGDPNLYRYVGNNPIVYIDPFGLDRKLFGQDWVAPWDPSASVSATIDNYIGALTQAGVGIGTGAGSGATTGAAVGAVFGGYITSGTGIPVTTVGGAGVGGVAGAFSGLLTAASSDNLYDTARGSVIGGGVAGALNVVVAPVLSAALGPTLGGGTGAGISGGLRISTGGVLAVERVTAPAVAAEGGQAVGFGISTVSGHLTARMTSQDGGGGPAPGAGGHPDAAKARELADAMKRLDEMERQAQQGHLNPELIEDIRRSKAILQNEINRIFGIGQ